MLTFSLILILLALACVLLSALGKLPIWVAVLFVVLAELLERVPVR